MNNTSKDFATPAAHTCTGCDPAEGFCRDCREAERKAAHTCTPADERAKSAVAALPEAWEKLADGFAAQGGAIDIAEAASMRNDAKELREAIAKDAIAAQGAGTAPVGVAPADYARTYLMSQDLYGLLMDVQNGIDSPATVGLANKLIVRLDKIRDMLATHPAPVSTAAAPDGFEEAIGVWLSARDYWQDEQNENVKAAWANVLKFAATVSTAAATTASASDVPCYGASRPSEMCPCRDCEAWRERVAKTMGRAADGQQGASRAVLDESFADWLAREMPAGTVISDPAWWAPRILSAALARAPLPAQAVASVVSRSGNDLRIAWLRPEQCDVGTLLYCAQSDTTGDH